MKNKIRITVLSVMLLIIVANINCNKDNGGEVFIPNIENQWVNKANAADFFDIGPPAQPNVNSSTFTGTEDSASVVSYGFSGSFTNHDVQFTYDNTSGYKSGKTYSGTINDASNVMTLHSNDLGDLVLEKP